MPTKQLHPKSTRLQRGEGMTGAACRRALARLEISQVGAASFFGVSDRFARKWMVDGPPLPIAYVLRIMVADSKWTAEKIAKL